MLLTYLWITHRLPPRDKFFNYIRTEQLRTGQETWACWLNVQRSQGNVALWICSLKSQVILDHGWNVGHYIRLYRIYSKERRKGSVNDVIYHFTGTARYTQENDKWKQCLRISLFSIANSVLSEWCGRDLILAFNHKSKLAPQADVMTWIARW